MLLESAANTSDTLLLDKATNEMFCVKLNCEGALP